MSFRKAIMIAVAAALFAPTAALAVDPWPAPLPPFRQGLVQLAPTELEPTEIVPDATAVTDPGTGPVTRTVSTTTVNATDANAAIANPQPVILMAEVMDGSGPIRDGVTWRVYDTKTDSTGQLALADRSNDAVAQMALKPGTYVVHAAYGRAQVTDTLEVVEGQNQKSVVLEAGGLRLNASVSGDVPIPINLLRFDVYTSGGSESDRTLVAEGLGANDIVTLNSGTYHVVSYFGSVNAVVRADLRVEPGQLTEATLFHKAAQLSFRLVSEAGGEAIADVDWTVQDSAGKTVFTNIGAFPATVLQAGDYTVLARRGQDVFNREFQVQPGQPREIEVLTAVY